MEFPFSFHFDFVVLHQFLLFYTQITFENCFTICCDVIRRKCGCSKYSRAWVSCFKVITLLPCFETLIELNELISCVQRNFVGTECRGIENLLLMDRNTLAFKSGKCLYFFDITQKILSIGKRTDGLIGAITVIILFFNFKQIIQCAFFF